VVAVPVQVLPYSYFEKMTASFALVVVFAEAVAETAV